MPVTKISAQLTPCCIDDQPILFSLLRLPASSFFALRLACGLTSDSQKPFLPLPQLGHWSYPPISDPKVLVILPCEPVLTVWVL